MVVATCSNVHVGFLKVSSGFQVGLRLRFNLGFNLGFGLGVSLGFHLDSFRG